MLDPARARRAPVVGESEGGEAEPAAGEGGKGRGKERVWRS